MSRQLRKHSSSEEDIKSHNEKKRRRRRHHASDESEEEEDKHSYTRPKTTKKSREGEKHKRAKKH